MPLDVSQTGLGSEITLLRALAEGRRRQSLVDRALRERREKLVVPDIPIRREVSNGAPSRLSHPKP